MATKESWEARDRFLSTATAINRYAADIHWKFGELKAIKETIMDNAAKRADLVALLAEDPMYRVSDFQTMYASAKAANDALEALFNWA
jgi:hypothetical protein